MQQEKDLSKFDLRDPYDLTELNSIDPYDLTKLKSRDLYELRCRCKEKFLITKKTKKRKPSKRSEGRPIYYLQSDERQFKTFQLRYEKKLSSIAKLVLNSFQKKYIYYAIDDLLYSFQSNPKERDNLLAILYSPVLSLQNNFSINFFDIWIDEIYINEVSKINKFITNDSSNLEQFSDITMKLVYKTRIPVKKPDSLW